MQKLYNINSRLTAFGSDIVHELEISFQLCTRDIDLTCMSFQEMITKYKDVLQRTTKYVDSFRQKNMTKCN